MESRPYRPEIGRFLVQDRFEDSRGDLNLESDPLTQNPYAFAGGNPANRVEWDGHSFLDDIDSAWDSTANERQAVGDFGKGVGTAAYETGKGLADLQQSHLTQATRLPTRPRRSTPSRRPPRQPRQSARTPARPGGRPRTPRARTARLPAQRRPPCPPRAPPRAPRFGAPARQGKAPPAPLRPSAAPALPKAPRTYPRAHHGPPRPGGFGHQVEPTFLAPGTDRSPGPAAHSYLVKQSRRAIRGRPAFRRAQTLCGASCRFDITRVGTRLPLTITDLRPNTTYYYAVAARDNVSRRLGPRSRAVRVRTTR